MVEPLSDCDDTAPVRLLATVEGEPVRDAWYEFVGLDSTGTPLPGASGRDRVTTGPVAPPRNVQAAIVGTQLVVTWTPVPPNGVTFDPGLGIGWYQYTVVNSVYENLLGNDQLRTPRADIALADLAALNPGEYWVRVFSVTVPPDHSQIGPETSSDDNLEWVHLSVTADGTVHLLD